MKKEKNNNIVFLRFLAILIVMFGHAIIIYDPGWGYYTTYVTSNKLMNIKHMINVIQMPLYFAISGYVFYYTISKYSSKIQIFISKCKRLMIPYITFSLFLIVPLRYFLKYESYKGNSFLYNIWYNIILGHDCGHLWFILALFLMFIPFLFINKKDNKLIDTLLFVLFIVLNIFSYKYTQYLNYFMYYSIFFYLGFIFNKYKINKNLDFGWIIIPILLLILFNHYTFVEYKLYFIKLALILAILIILFNINFDSYGKNKIVNKISKNSFGMYLIHSPMIVFLFKYYPNIHPLLTILINFVLLGLFSYLLTSLIRKTKIKFIIGE